MSLRATSAEINISALLNNLEKIRYKVGKQRKICLALKANAYGHGMIPIAQVTELYVDFFAVATVDEGIQLRESGIKIPILILSPFLKREIESVFRYNLTPVITHLEFLDSFAKYSQSLETPFNIHVKINTGMNRSGFSPCEVVETVKNISKYTGLKIEGICTHFASSDDFSDQGRNFTKNQIVLFEEILQKLKGIIPYPFIIHAANTSGFLNYNTSHFDMIRIGLGAYGYPLKSELNLIPIMTLKTQVVHSQKIKAGECVSYGASWQADRDTHIVLLPVGYGDGIPRSLSNIGQVKINHQYYPIVGRICMDLLMVDTGDDFIPLETEVLIFGNDAVLNAETIAEKIGTISYEVVTSISARVQRVYYKE